MWVGQLGSGVGIFNGIFQVTAVSLGIDLFIYIVSVRRRIALVLLISETQVQKYQLNNEEPASTAGSSNVEVQSIGFPGVSSLAGLPPRTFKILAEHPLIVFWCFSLLGMSSLISSSDFITIFLSIELQSFTVYILAALYRDSQSATFSGLKYFLLGSLSSAIILLGSGLVYGYTGLTSFEGLYMLCSTTVVNQYIEFSVLLIIVGLLFKVAAAPFHNYAPDVYDGVPTIVTAWLTTMPKISLFLFLLEFQGFALLSNWSTWTQLLLFSSMLSFIVGALYRVKRLLAYSSISHVGFLILALAVNSVSSVNSLLFYLVQYSLTNVLIFFVLIGFGTVLVNTVDRYSPVQFISQLKGQFHVNPLLSTSLMISLISLTGIPPLVGFFPKMQVLYSSLSEGYYFLTIIAIIASVISAAYYLSIIRVIYFEPALSEGTMYTTLDTLSSFIIANLTLLITFFMLNPTLLLHSLHLLALSIFTV
jgi:NADH-ubiquinone oxidoreductase chain 2